MTRHGCWLRGVHPRRQYLPWLRNLLPLPARRVYRRHRPHCAVIAGARGRRVAIGTPDLLRGYCRNTYAASDSGANLLVNLTVDSWYGAASEPWEHLALAVFATVELRVAMVRAVNSGVSALIDPNGRMLAKTYSNDPYRNPRASDGIVVAAPLMQGGRTIYVAVGNLFAYLCLAATLIILGAALRGARARHRAPGN